MARAKPGADAPAPQDRAEFDRRRRNRNIALGVLLAGLVVLFYVLSIVRMGVR
jgi:ferric-dicitrate binding protein FerR (iron transport regulator)